MPNPILLRLTLSLECTFSEDGGSVFVKKKAISNVAPGLERRRELLLAFVVAVDSSLASCIVAAIPSEIGKSYNSSWRKEGHELLRECVGLVSSVKELAPWRGVGEASWLLVPVGVAGSTKDKVGSDEQPSVLGPTAVVEFPAVPSRVLIRSMARDVRPESDKWRRWVSESCIEDVKTLCIPSTESWRRVGEKGTKEGR
jgi:hypothetical protein